MPVSLLACVFPRPADAESISHYDACSIVDLVTSGLPEGVQVKLLVDPTFSDFQQAKKEVSPSHLYFAGRTSFDQNKAAGSVGSLEFSDRTQSWNAVVEACGGVESVFLDCASQEGVGAKLQAAGVQHVVAWPEQTQIPAVVAGQFSHTLFSSLLFLRSSIPEAYALASHVTQAHCTTVSDGQYVPPPLPVLTSLTKSALPDNSTIAPPNISGLDPAVPLATSVPGWADIRLLAPRAELRLLLTGNASLIDSAKLSFLGEALRALLVLEMRGLTLLNTTPCTKTPANLPLGCEALRCEIRTVSGAEVVAILGGQPSVLAERPLVEHALRMTLVADSLSLQFRLPPPGVATPVPRHSAAIAGGVPVVDALVLTSVWAVHVLRSLSLVPSYRSLISLGVAAVGGTATLGVTSLDAQRLKMIVSGSGPAANKATPIQTPGVPAAPPPPVPPAPTSNDGSGPVQSSDGIVAGA